MKALFLIAAFPCLLSAQLTIRNELLKVELRPADGTFSIATAGGKVFVRGGKLAQGGGTASVSGQSIGVVHANGNTSRIHLVPKTPLALFSGTVRHDADKVRLANFPLELAGSLKVLGTGGLSDPDKAKGSYMWMAVADSHSRNGVVGGWITTDRGSGVVLPGMIAQIDYGKLRVEPGKSAELETFAIGYFDDARLGLEAWADAVAQHYHIKLPPQMTGYCTWYHARASDEKKLAAQTDFAARNLKPFGLDFIQIDDGWQDGVKENGPKKNFTRVYEKGPYPNGMKPTADYITAAGLVPGIWFMPFAGNYKDPWFADKQDWFAKREDGKPYDVFWGGTSLDMTNPAAKEYLRGMVQRIAHEWGFRYFKMDGLYTGTATEMEYINDSYKDDHIGNAVLHDPSKTNIEMYRDGLKLVRETAGPKVFLLGCTVAQNMRSYGGAFGLLDAMRIGPDNNTTWKGLVRGPTYGSRNYHLHGRIWYNDPDPLYVRPSLPLNQARMISAWVTVSGQLSASSDAYADLPAERLDLLKRTMPAHGLQARPVDLFENDIPRMWLVSRGDRHVIGLFNWEEKDLTIDYPIERFGLAADREYAAFDYWTNSLVPMVKGKLKFELPAAAKVGTATDRNSSAVLAVREVAKHPQVISTSRHIMQGLTDLLEEKWDAGKPSLSGTSKVVGGDDYELRLLTDRKTGAVDVSPADKAAGVKVISKAEDRLVRVRIQSPVSRAVQWVVKF